MANVKRKLIMKRYIKNNQIKTRQEIVIVKNGMRTINPTEEQILADGWEEYVAPVYEPTEEEIANREKAFEIRNAKAELANSDYKIIKCMEAYLCGEELPYNITELHAERNTKRNKINELEHAE